MKVKENAKPVAGDDASDAKFYEIKYILENKNEIAFDHYNILIKALIKLNLN